MRVCVTVWLMLGLTGCIEQGLVSTPWGRDGADFPPQIEVMPDRLDFGELGPHEEKTLSFVVRNVAESPYAYLDVSEVSLSVPTGFMFVDEVGDPIDSKVSFGLGQGMEQELFVRFAPDSPIAHEALAMVRSNDEGHGAVPVTLEGLGLIPKLDISPSPYDYGAVTVSCEREAPFMLTNIGNAPLTVTSLSEDMLGLELTSIPSLPLVLEPGETQEAVGRFAPSEGASYEGEIAALSNDPVSETLAVVQGLGHVPGLHRQTWELEVNPAVDVLFVVDRSLSMEDDHAALSDNFSDFIWAIDDYTPNWAVMVAMPDDGCNLNGTVDRTVDDYDEVFEEAVTEDAAPGSLYTEAGLIVADRSIQETDHGECNDGFLREDARLHIIMVADEPEQSPYAWDTYVSEIVAKKGDQAKVKISAVAGDYPWGCLTEDNSAEAGSGYYEAARATYGKFLSLCNRSWYENALELAKATVRQDTFPLERWPDPATVKVWQNGEPAEYWQYDAYLNAVVFDTFKEPREGDVVEVEYHDPYTCD